MDTPLPSNPSDRLEVAARLADLPLATEWLTRKLEAVGATTQAVYIATLVLEELFTNTVRHGFDDAPEQHRVVLECTVVGDRFRLVYRDEGRPFNPFTECPAPSLDAPLAERPIGGLGVHFICQMAEHRSYERRAGWNVITFERCYRCSDLLP